MKRYLKLVDFEFNRFLKLYLVLFGITILSQIIGVIVESRNYLNHANRVIYQDLVPIAEFLENYRTISLIEISYSAWFMGPIVICGVTLIIYVFFIWYRDWLGKNTFSYRLLMLPIARIHVYLAKATTILLYVLGLVALQLILLPIESQVLKWMVPSEFRTDLTISQITGLSDLRILFPHTFIEFVLYYGGGITAVFIVFTAILFERSFRIKGIIYGVLYCAISLFIFMAPILMNEFILGSYFYPIELFFIELVAGIVVLACAIWTGNFLIKNKIRV
ncbi:hypothetical protein MHZ95_11635 [Sporosarcina sp. ACRSM]|uniref:ABC-2 family transporter protein n=1 Tax=Sporosarcina soli TaxID=334736 RepID=A0ABW0TM54_9BACL|nr:hypothetical protein [Sporosarcina sp. ACRSM]MCG7335933.1 hypothetical protein [Sporosarcina sp. ACRSM]